MHEALRTPRRSDFMGPKCRLIQHCPTTASIMQQVTATHRCSIGKMALKERMAKVACVRPGDMHAFSEDGITLAASARSSIDGGDAGASSTSVIPLLAMQSTISLGARCGLLCTLPMFCRDINSRRNTCAACLTAQPAATCLFKTSRPNVPTFPPHVMLPHPGHVAICSGARRANLACRAEGAAEEGHVLQAQGGPGADRRGAAGATAGEAGMRLEPCVRPLQPLAR